MTSTRPIPERGSLRSRAAARATQSTLRPIASRLPFGRGGERVARVLVEVAMRACGGIAPGTVVRTVREDGVVGEWVDARAGRRPVEDGAGRRPVEGGDGSVGTAGPILYLHGSAYAICSARTHRGLASRLSRATQRPVFVVDYRLAPEFPFPAAADDVERAYRWLLSSGHAPESVVVAGDSAGGHLALDLVLDNARRSVPQPSAVLLFSPLIDLTFTLAQNRERIRRDPMISAAAARALTALYTRGEDPDGRRLRLAVEAGTALPHFVVQAGGAEMLVADAEHLRDLVVESMTMAFDFDAMLDKIKDRQWSLADIDWDAPGAEMIPPEQHAKLKPFLSDLMWIENVGARGFAAMARKAPTETLREIYRYFHAEEQKHANAELALMRRWGMLENDEIPQPNVNVKLIIDWLDKYSDQTPLAVLGTVIPMLEVALDGALVKFIVDEIDDPVCQEVFKRINADESRHLAVDFEVIDLLGHAKMRRILVETIGAWMHPSLIIGTLRYIPLLNKMRDNIVEMGVDEERLYTAMKRFKKVGERSEFPKRLPMYRFISWHGSVVINRDHPYHKFADSMVTLTAKYPKRLLRPQPTWSKELTYEPVA